MPNLLSLSQEENKHELLARVAIGKALMKNVDITRKRATFYIPVSLLAIDTAYQIPERTNRPHRIRKLANEWDEARYIPIVVVYHPEEGLFYVVDGYGRWQASQIQGRVAKHEELEATVLLEPFVMNYSPEKRQIVLAN